MHDSTVAPLGVILAGGRSSRMGRDKSGLAIGGIAMIERVAATLRAAGCELLVVGRSDGGGGVHAVPDDVPGRGPAAGLATALRVAEGRPVLLVATDQPFLRMETAEALLGLDGDSVVPVDAGVRQTTCAVYRAACRGPLEELQAESPFVSIQDLLNRVTARLVAPTEWTEWGEDGRSWWSIDTPEALAEAEEWLRGNPEGRAQSRET